MEKIGSVVNKIKSIFNANYMPAYATAGGLGIKQSSPFDVNKMFFSGKSNGSGGLSKLTFPCVIDEKNLRTLLTQHDSLEGKFVFHTKRKILGLDSLFKKLHRDIALVTMPGSEKDIPDIVGGIISFTRDNKTTLLISFVPTSTCYEVNKSLVELKRYLEEILKKNDIRVKSSEIVNSMLHFDIKLA